MIEKEREMTAEQKTHMSLLLRRMWSDFKQKKSSEQRDTEGSLSSESK